MVKNALLRLFGAAVSSRPGRAVIARLAVPGRHLLNLDGRRYMGRWHIVDEDTVLGLLLEKLTGYASVRLHHICSPDHDRDLHNHPFDYRTFVLEGWYTAEVEDDFGVVLDYVAAGHTAASSAETYHRVHSVPERGVWTLFFMGRNTGAWGFKVDGEYVPSPVYLERKGFTRPPAKA